MRKYIEYSELDDYKIQLIEALKEGNTLKEVIKNMSASFSESNFLKELINSGVEITIKSTAKNKTELPLYFKNNV